MEKEVQSALACELSKISGQIDTIDRIYYNLGKEFTREGKAETDDVQSAAGNIYPCGRCRQFQ